MSGGYRCPKRQTRQNTQPRIEFAMRSLEIEHERRTRTERTSRELRAWRAAVIAIAAANLVSLIAFLAYNLLWPTSSEQKKPRYVVSEASLRQSYTSGIRFTMQAHDLQGS